MADARALLQNALHSPSGATAERSPARMENHEDEYRRYCRKARERQNVVTEDQLQGLLASLVSRQPNTDFTIPKVQRPNMRTTNRQDAKERLIVQKKLRQLQREIRPMIQPVAGILPAIKVKCKRPAEVVYRIDAKGTCKCTVTERGDLKPLVREYLFENNRFISPYMEAIERRKMRRMQKRLGARADRERDVQIIARLDYDEENYLRPASP